MKSGIFAVANLGPLKLYVGETHQLQTRWKTFIQQFETNTFPHPQLQQAWNQTKDRRQFTFHTAEDIAHNQQILGREQFFLDLTTKDQPIPPKQSGIFAVVTLGSLKLYVGEAHLLKARWQAFMAKFNSNTFPHPRLQQAWNQAKDQRQFTFHTAEDIAKTEGILGRKQFLLDLEERKKAARPSS